MTHSQFIGITSTIILSLSGTELRAQTSKPIEPAEIQLQAVTNTLKELGWELEATAPHRIHRFVKREATDDDLKNLPDIPFSVSVL